MTTHPPLATEVSALRENNAALALTSLGRTLPYQLPKLNLTPAARGKTRPKWVERWLGPSLYIFWSISGSPLSCSVL